MTIKDEKKRLVEITRHFAGLRILVLGDVMLDQFIYGGVERISPEAPVPVVKVDDELYRLGGAANVASNLTALGAHVELCGLIGNDYGGEQVTEIGSKAGIGIRGMVKSAKCPTTIKTRIIAHNQQVVRFDREGNGAVSKRTRDRLIEQASNLIAETDAVIVSDYGKGAIFKALLDLLRKRRGERDLIVSVDPKIGNIRHYRGMTIMTPNQHEAGQVIGRRIRNTDDEMAKAGNIIRKRLALDSLLITRAGEGMTLISHDTDPVHIPTAARQVFDVTGAGDTVIATLTLAMATGAPLVDAARVANFAAGVVVGKLGTATTDVREIAQTIRKG